MTTLFYRNVRLKHLVDGAPGGACEGEGEDVEVFRAARALLALEAAAHRTCKGAVKETLSGGQFDLVWLSTRVPHAAHVW